MSPASPRNRKGKANSGNLFAAAFGPGESQYSTVGRRPIRPSMRGDRRGGESQHREVEDVLDLIEQDPNKVTQVLRHPALRAGYPNAARLLESMLQLDQRERASCAELVCHEVIRTYVSAEARAAWSVQPDDILAPGSPGCIIAQGSDGSDSE